MWDKNKPAGNQKIRLSDEEIRANWAALEDALSREHIFPGTEGEDAGEHKALTLRQQSSAPNTGSGKVGIYPKDDGHLYYVDPDGNEFKIWHEGNDGENSGLDADTVRGVEPSTLAKKDLSNVDDNMVLNKVKNVDGSGSGLDTDFIRGLPGDFTCSLAENGYAKFPNGLIIQWGRVNDVQQATVNFPIEFPNACLNAHVTQLWNNTSTKYTPRVLSYNKSSITIWWGSDYSTGADMFWLAIGY